MLPMTIIGYVAANVALAGSSPLPFLAALVLPHGIFEIPAIVLAMAAILNLGATLTAPADGKTIGEAWLLAAAKWARMMIAVVLPLFLLAALVEVYITPQVAVLILGK
jgi:stage II sporulation protein M